MRLMFATSLVMILASCAARGFLTVFPEAGADGAEIQSVFVASNRLPAPVESGQLFTSDFGGTRDPRLHFARLDLSVPPAHRTGRIEWPGKEPVDPARHFVVTGDARYRAMGDFLQAVDAQRGSEVLLFVHGFNVNNAEAVYRLAQIAHDFDAELPVIAFSWPSSARPGGYVYDRDSVIFSRDALEDVLIGLTSGHRKVLVVAHSMGSQLVMETLRQLSLSGRGHVLTRLSGVALISPDIDENVFRRQAARIRPFPTPFMLMVSTRDRALNLSAFLTGTPWRLGSIKDKKRLADLPVEVVDLSDFEGGDWQHHSTAFTAPAAIDLLRQLDRD